MRPQPLTPSLRITTCRFDVAGGRRGIYRLDSWGEGLPGRKRTSGLRNHVLCRPGEVGRIGDQESASINQTSWRRIAGITPCSSRGGPPP
jgi:hypothetical protein